MVFYSYYQPVPGDDFPDPKGPLSTTIPRQAIQKRINRCKRWRTWWCPHSALGCSSQLSCRHLVRLSHEYDLRELWLQVIITAAALNLHIYGMHFDSTAT